MTALKIRVRSVLVTLGWAITIASVVLQTLYQRPLLTALDVTLLFLISVLAGMALVDAEVIVLSYVGSLSLSILIMFGCLTLPAALGRIRYAQLNELLYGGAVVMILRSMFPALWPLVCLIGGLAGGFAGEKLRLR